MEKEERRKNVKGEETEKRAESIFQEIMAKNFHNLVKETDIQVQGSHRVPNKMKSKEKHQDTL